MLLIKVKALHDPGYEYTSAVSEVRGGVADKDRVISVMAIRLQWLAEPEGLICLFIHPTNLLSVFVSARCWGRSNKKTKEQPVFMKRIAY